MDETFHLYRVFSRIMNALLKTAVTSFLATSAAWAGLALADTVVAPSNPALESRHVSSLSTEGALTRQFAIKEGAKMLRQAPQPGSVRVEGAYNTVAIIQEPYDSALLKNSYFVSQVQLRPELAQLSALGFTEVRLTNGADSLVVYLANPGMRPVPVSMN